MWRAAGGLISPLRVQQIGYRLRAT